MTVPSPPHPPDEILHRVYQRSGELRARRRSRRTGLLGFAAGVVVTAIVAIGAGRIGGGNDRDPQQPGLASATTDVTGLSATNGTATPPPGRPTPGSGPPGTLLWRSGVIGAAGTGPALGGALAFVAAGDQTVYGLDARSGQVRWSHTVSGCCGAPGALTEPTVDYASGLVLVGGPDTPLTALDAGTGTVRWTTSGGTPVPVVGGLAVTAQLAIAASGGGVVAFDIGTGDQRWSVAEAAALPAVDGDRAVVVLTGAAGPSRQEAVALDVGDGRIIWRHPLAAPVSARLTFAGAAVVVRDDTATIHVLALADGAERTTISPPGGCRSCPPQVAPLASQPTVDGNTVVFAAGADIVAADLTTGRIAWEVPTGAAVRSSPVADHGVVYVGSDDHQIRAIRVADGTVLWQGRLAGPVAGGLALTKDSVLATAVAGNLAALRR